VAERRNIRFLQGALPLHPTKGVTPLETETKNSVFAGKTEFIVISIDF